jgi:hypothetical protein
VFYIPGTTNYFELIFNLRLHTDHAVKKLNDAITTPGYEPTVWKARSLFVTNTNLGNLE